MNTHTETKRGISRAGDDATNRIMRITGAVKTEKSSDGDFVFETSLGEGKDERGGTINQVRPCKYLPIVVWHEENEATKKKWDEGKSVGRSERKTTGWYVLPAHTVIKIVRDRRGQHQPNPFLYTTISINQVDVEPCTDEKLTQRLRDAIEESNRFPELKAAMEKISEEAEFMAIKHKQMVQTILSQQKITRV